MKGCLAWRLAGTHRACVVAGADLGMKEREERRKNCLQRERIDYDTTFYIDLPTIGSPLIFESATWNYI